MQDTDRNGNDDVNCNTDGYSAENRNNENKGNNTILYDNRYM